MFFTTGANATVFASGVQPRTGAQHLEFNIANDDADEFVGVFQGVNGITPGMAYEFSGWNASPAGLLGTIAEIRLEWRNSVTDTTVNFSPNTTPILSSIYTPFSVIDVAPVGADQVRLVYILQSFAPGVVHAGTVFVDDVAFNQVPEPGGYAMLVGVGLTGAAALWRRFRSVS